MRRRHASTPGSEPADGRPSLDSEDRVGQDADDGARVRSGGDGKEHVDGKAGTLLAEQPTQTKWKSFRTRALSSCFMIGSFVGVIYMGHVYLALLVLCIQTLMVRELFKLAAIRRSEENLPGFRAQQWYFYWAMIFTTYGRFLEANLYAEIAADARLLKIFGWVLAHHNLVSYMMYVLGFVSFVYGLKKGYYMYQITQFCWTHMIIITIVLQSSFFVANVFEGMIWFIMPVSIVVLNDITAYLWGFTIGRTPLIKLSPKKTWEGFIGAFVSTVVLSWYMAKWLSRYKWMVCPRTNLQVTGWLDCDVDEIYQTMEFDVAGGVLGVLPEVMDPAVHKALDVLFTLLPNTVACMPVQLHALSLATFASAIAPFGGFFASGFKRAFKIKDFGDSIPGHGGLTDRMDCQIVMAAFSYMYYTSFVKSPVPTVGHLLALSSRMSVPQQLELYRKLRNVLEVEGVRLMAV